MLVHKKMNQKIICSNNTNTNLIHDYMRKLDIFFMSNEYY